MRSLFVVIDEILSLIPKSEAALRTDLAKIQKWAAYKAPEICAEGWQATAQVLYRHIPLPKEDWQLRIQAIFNGTESLAGKVEG